MVSSKKQHQGETRQIIFGLSLAVRIREFQLNVTLICNHLCQEYFSVYPALDGNLCRLILLLWEASHGTDVP